MRRFAYPKPQRNDRGLPESGNLSLQHSEDSTRLEPMAPVYKIGRGQTLSRFSCRRYYSAWGMEWSTACACAQLCLQGAFLR